MTAVLATALAPLVVLLLVIGGRRAGRRSSFGATVARHHPELAAVLDVDLGELGRVAARAVDVRTPAAPRQLGVVIDDKHAFARDELGGQAHVEALQEVDDALSPLSRHQRRNTGFSEGVGVHGSKNSTMAGS